jgi:hypothetical protein
MATVSLFDLHTSGMTILAAGSVPTETKTGSLTSKDLCAAGLPVLMTFRSIKARGNFIGYLVGVPMTTLASLISDCDARQELLSAKSNDNLCWRLWLLRVTSASPCEKPKSPRGGLCSNDLSNRSSSQQICLEVPAKVPANE